MSDELRRRLQKSVGTNEETLCRFRRNCAGATATEPRSLRALVTNLTEAAESGVLLQAISRPRSPRAGDKEVKVVADLPNGGCVDVAKLTFYAPVGECPDLLRHGIGGAGTPGRDVGRHRAG